MSRLNKIPLVQVNNDNVQVQSNSSNLATESTLSTLKNTISTTTNTSISQINGNLMNTNSNLLYIKEYILEPFMYKYSHSSRPINSIQCHFGNFTTDDTVYRVPINDTGASVFEAQINDSKLRIVSTDNSDNELNFYIEGYTSDNTKTSEILTCNGQTESSESTNTYRFITKFRKSTPSNTTGTDYLYRSGQTVTSRIPTNYLSKIDTVNSYNGYIHSIRLNQNESLHIHSIKINKLDGSDGHILHLVKHMSGSIFSSAAYRIEKSFNISGTYLDIKDIIIPFSQSADTAMAFAFLVLS